MDSIKKKMEKLANETADAEARIAHFEEIKAANDAEADKFEDQLRNVQKKIQGMESQFDVCTRTSSTRPSSSRRWRRRPVTPREMSPPFAPASSCCRSKHKTQ